MHSLPQISDMHALVALHPLAPGAIMLAAVVIAAVVATYASR